VLVRLPDGSVGKADIGQIQRARTQSLNPGGVGGDWAPAVYGSYLAQSSPAYAAITKRAKAIRSARLKVHRTLSDGQTEPLPDHELQGLLDKVNPWWTGGDLMEATEQYLSTYGSAFWFLNGATANTLPESIWPLHPSTTKIVPAADGDYIKGFISEVNGKRIAMLPEEVVWFRYFNVNDEYAGLSPMASARVGLDIGKSAQIFNERFFRNGAMPQDIVYVMQGPVDQDEIDAFYASLDQRHAGAGNAHRPMVIDLTESGEPKRLGISQRDMEFLGSLNFSVEEAARVWSVPPPLLMSQQASTYNNVKEARIFFYSSFVSEEWDFLEEEMNELLVPHTGDPSIFLAFDRSNVLPLKEAMAELEEGQRKDVERGILTINEVRTQRNLEDVPWGDTPPGMQSGDGSEEPPEPPEPEEPEEEPEDDDVFPFSLSAKSIDVEARERAWKAFDGKLSTYETRFAAMQRGLFDAQRRETLRQVRRLAAKDYAAVVKTLTPVFDAQDWEKKFIDAGRPLMEATLVMEGRRVMEDFGLGSFDNQERAAGDFDPRGDGIDDFLTDRSEFWSQRVNQETAENLTATIAQGLEANEGIPELQARVQNVFTWADTVRTERIARTESLVAANKGHLSGYDQAGTVTEKEWVTTLDSRTRDAHINANGQRVPIGTQFLVGGEFLDAPGFGSASNVVNCRCTTVPIIDENLIGRSNGRVKSLPALT
jgi:HK97 family phage portal protein